MSYRIGNLWLPMNVLLLCVNVIAQPGYVSLHCGGKGNHTARNNVTWVSDANYIEVGRAVDIEVGRDYSEQTYGSYVHSLRYFPKPLRKACYQFPVVPNVPYLLRTWFAIGNYTGFKQQPGFGLSYETLGMLAYRNIRPPYDSPWYHERVIVSLGTVLYHCFIRTSANDDPFVTAIEFRPLKEGMYRKAKPGRSLKKDERVDFAAKALVRYPDDSFDRIWTSGFFFDVNGASGVRSVTAKDDISTKNTQNLPPSLIMQTAFILNSSAFPIRVATPRGSKSVVYLYLAEIENLTMSQLRSFSVLLNGVKMSDVITLENHSALELTFDFNETDELYLTVETAGNSTNSPIINAYESFEIVDTDQATSAQDIQPLDVIKTRFDIQDWISDPCYIIPWEGISCNNRSSEIRISELNLAGRNFTGTVPADIGQLTGLVNLSLANNKLIGALPDFSNLTMLERLYVNHNNLTGSVPGWLSQLKNLKELSLDNNNFVGWLPNFSNLTALGKLHLSNNNLSGPVPEWLSQLQNLKELFIENNNFSGVIPPQLLIKTSLDLRYSGNRYLCVRTRNGNCVLDNSRKSKLNVVLGLAIGGVLIICLALTAGAYWKKSRTKEHKEYAIITVPNPSMCRAFTPREITAATGNFSRKIGQGGFGSVFFGKLPQGKEIAVKVLSLFSRQGINEFQNEVDLLSRINHKNLVSLLGYCNESSELMLIYDHMSGGSLRDRLYGSGAELAALPWKKRLKIVLDAAKGLEYLHVGSTPRIIHRDIKSSNILLDIYMNGKLADFGLSKMTAEEGGDSSHVTTMVKGTPGYMDPEYFRTQMLTEKSDVYSFGVVLLEVICGRPPICTNLPEDELNIIQWVTSYVSGVTDGNPSKSVTAEIEEIIDKSMGENYEINAIVDCAKLALRCVDAKPTSRPTASEVVAALKEIIGHESNKNAVPVSGEIFIGPGDWEVNPIRLHDEPSKPNDMLWHDNSWNLSQVGR